MHYFNGYMKSDRNRRELNFNHYNIQIFKSICKYCRCKLSRHLLRHRMFPFGNQARSFALLDVVFTDVRRIEGFNLIAIMLLYLLLCSLIWRLCVALGVSPYSLSEKSAKLMLTLSDTKPIQTARLKRETDQSSTTIVASSK